MAQDATKVIVPGTGRFWTCDVDTAPPIHILAITGAPTGGSFTITAAGGTTDDITFVPTGSGMPKAIATALAALSQIGAGKVLAVVPISQYSFGIVFDPSITPGTVTVSASLTGGTTPAATVTAPDTPFSDWDEVGFTSKDNPLQINRSGGDITTVDAWQQAAIESSTAPISYAWAFSLAQGDVSNMRLYYGSNASLGTDGMLHPAPTPSATEKALMNIINNNGKAQIRHASRSSILAADAQSFDTTKLLDYPVAGTILAPNVLAYQQGISQVGAAA